MIILEWHVLRIATGSCVLAELDEVLACYWALIGEQVHHKISSTGLQVHRHDMCGCVVTRITVRLATPALLPLCAAQCCFWNG